MYTRLWIGIGNRIGNGSRPNDHLLELLVKSDFVKEDPINGSRGFFSVVETAGKTKAVSVRANLLRSDYS